jgi:hypothetical protein
VTAPKVSSPKPSTTKASSPITKTCCLGICPGCVFAFSALVYGAVHVDGAG